MLTIDTVVNSSK